MQSRDHMLHCYWHISTQFVSHLLYLSIYCQEAFDCQKINKTVDQNLNFIRHMFTEGAVTWMIAVRRNSILFSLTGQHFIAPSSPVLGSSSVKCCSVVFTNFTIHSHLDTKGVNFIQDPTYQGAVFK